MKVLGYKEGFGVYLHQEKGFKGATDSKGYTREDMERGVEKALRFSLVSRHLRWLQGEVLTVLDASAPQGPQLKAMKDLVKDKFSAKISWLYEVCGTPEDEQGELINTDEETIN